MIFNLDDITKTSICVPFKKPPNKPTNPSSTHNALFFSTPHFSRDLPFPTGNELRFNAYRMAWGKCLARMQEILTDLQKATVDEVVNAVVDSDPNPCMTRFPGLPYPELPVIAFLNPTLGPSLLHKVIARLETKSPYIDAVDTDTEMDDRGSPSSTSQQQPPCLVVQFRAGDFPSVMAGMKALVTGLMDKGKSLQYGEKKATASTSLAGYDIRYLEAWYISLTASKGKEVPNQLVVILHDFEQFDPYVMQDLLYICSQASPALPLTFILSLSSPLPNFLNTIYPARTLALTRVKTVNAPRGQKVLNEVLKGTFFDVGFDPDIVIGPSVLDFLQDFFSRHHSSIDVVFTVLQLAHLKHFTTDPLAALVHSTPSTLLSQPKAAKFVDSLRKRLALSSSLRGPGNGEPRSTVVHLVEAIDKAREAFYARARDMRVGFGIILIIQAELRKSGYKGLEWASEGGSDIGVDVMIDVLRGRLGRDVRHLCTIVRKLRVDKLESVLQRLNTYLFELPENARVTTEEQEARTRLILLSSKLSQAGEAHVDVAKESGEWLREYLSDKLRLLEEVELWDVWYTRNSPPPSELLNPSVKANIVAGLLRPFEYAKDFSADSSWSESASGSGKDKGKALWELPDISILFKRYLDSGRMINVFDWFESFKCVLEMQRKYESMQDGGGGEDGEEKEVFRPKKRGKGKEKKTKSKGKEKESKMILMDQDEDEEWKLEVQARFIRSLHELDYLGFVKHTGRKREHVLKTLFEVGDDEGDDD